MAMIKARWSEHALMGAGRWASVLPAWDAAMEPKVDVIASRGRVSAQRRAVLRSTRPLQRQSKAVIARTPIVSLFATTAKATPLDKPVSRR